LSTKKKTTISISQSSKNILDIVGKRGDTYEDIIKQVVDYAVGMGYADSAKQKGLLFEKAAKKILINEGFTRVSLPSSNLYDLECYKDGNKIAVEVKGRSFSSESQNFTIRRDQLENIKKIPNSIYLLMNKFGYKIISSTELEKFSDPNFLINIYWIFSLPLNIFRKMILVGVEDKNKFIDEAIYEKLMRTESHQTASRSVKL